MNASPNTQTGPSKNQEEISRDLQNFFNYGLYTSGFLLIALFVAHFLITKTADNPYFSFSTQPFDRAFDNYLGFAGNGTLQVLCMALAVCLPFALFLNVAKKMSELTIEAFFYTVGFFAVSQTANFFLETHKKYNSASPLAETLALVIGALLVAFIVFLLSMLFRKFGANFIAKFISEMRTTGSSDEVEGTKPRSKVGPALFASVVSILVLIDVIFQPI
mgnify:CR=1 FL=1